MKTKKLYRPVGVKEFALIQQSGMKKFPPRLEWQPIFYPVLNEGYASEIAEKWNTNDEFSGYVGIVLSFEIPLDYFHVFEVQNVGAHQHNELWVPSEKLEEFNNKIKDGITIEKVFYGDEFTGDEIEY